MRKIIGSLLLIVSTWAQAVPVPLPDIYVTKVVNTGNDSGTYTVVINQPPLTGGIQPWYLSAWGITNQAATDVNTGLFGWSAWLLDDTTWDSGITFETDVPFPATPIYRFATGAGGIGDFDSVFGPTYSQAAVYWVSDYFGDPGLVATSSNFTWTGGAGNSTAFAVISNATSGENLACSIGVGSSATLSCAPIVNPVPIPAAVWLFGSGLIGLIGVARRKKA